MAVVAPSGFDQGEILAVLVEREVGVQRRPTVAILARSIHQRYPPASMLTLGKCPLRQIGAVVSQVPPLQS